MKSRLLILLGLFGLFATAAAPAFAQTTINPCATGQFNVLCIFDITKLGAYIGAIITVIFIIATLIALFFLIWGGIRWILSQGDKAKVTAARDTIIAAIVGLVITFLAYFILTLILGFFHLSLNNLTLPTVI